MNTTYSAHIPYGIYWSTPFAKWQGSLQHLHALKFAAHVTKQELAVRHIDPEQIDHAVVGMTVPQHQSFYGAPWFTGLIGLDKVTGPAVNQACATGVRTLLMAAQEIEGQMATMALAVTTDRCSNGPHVYYPAPGGPGGTGTHEDWVLDNFSNEPLGKHAMLDTAENVAKKYGISTEEQHEVVLRRYEQYDMALADNRAFQKRYIRLPFPVPKPNFKGESVTLQGDEGVFETTSEGLAKLKPIYPGGTVTFGGQTHPADGNTGMLVTTADRAKEISSDPKIQIRILGFGSARCELAYMPLAPVPAAKRALQQAGLEISKIDVIKSHNPFAVNDIVFSRETGIDLDSMNNYGCSLIWGHPQGPTGMRAIIEMIEELVIRGGGYGLFHGCAAGDSSMAVIIEVTDNS